ncbi:syndecan-like [Formica exsecta]|uniref:syndecan-like n=1 Tax=Formica exsecta TaxID=72781 RepID=UPI001141A9B3|nr:syndecan-like [Formica exsecta]
MSLEKRYEKGESRGIAREIDAKKEENDEEDAKPPKSLATRGNGRRCVAGYLKEARVYTKTVVDSSPNVQKYNPEVTFTTTSSTPVTYAGNTNISALIDQLRHINQLVQTQLASSPDAGAFLGDEALDGSGSGDSPDLRQHVNGENDDDEDGHDDDRDDDEASGSGTGPITSDLSTKAPPQVISGAKSSTILLPIALVIVCGSLIA